jgi:hypothetical protein
VDSTLEFVIPGTISDYYDGSSPNMTAKLQIEHTSNFDSGHYFWLDIIALGDIEVLYTAPDNASIGAILDDIEDTIYGLSALQVLLDALPILTEIEATTVLAKTGADGDTLETLSDQIDALILTGSRTITIQLYKTATTTPIADMAVSVFNSDQTLFLGRKTTDANGQIVIGRDDGTYKIVSKKAGVTPANIPETMVVDADATHTYYADVDVIAAPADPDACNLVCDLLDLGLNAKVGVEFVVALKNAPGAINSAILEATPSTGTTDAEGRVTFTLAQGFTYQVTSPALGDNVITIVITTESSIILGDVI